MSRIERARARQPQLPPDPLRVPHSTHLGVETVRLAERALTAGVVCSEARELGAALAQVRRDQGSFGLGDELLSVRVRLFDLVEPFDARRCQQGVGMHDVRVGLVMARSALAGNGDGLLRRIDGLAAMPEAELCPHQVHEGARFQVQHGSRLAGYAQARIECCLRFFPVATQALDLAHVQQRDDVMSALRERSASSTISPAT